MRASIVLFALLGCSAAGAEADAPPVAPGPVGEVAEADAPEVSAPAEAQAPEARAPVAEVPTNADATPPPAAEGQPGPKPEPEPEPDPHVHADLDPSNDWVVGPPEPLEDCEERLEAAGISYKPARIGVGRKHEGVYTCGAKQVVRYKRGPGKIKYSKSSPLLTCTMALALVDLERVVQEEAEAIFGSRVVKIDHMGTYNCRKMANYDFISEHSFANGIDLKAFTLANGRQISVLDHFKPNVPDEECDDRAKFLRRVANRLWDEQVFSVVVTPYFDNLHRNHIHVDLARYRVDGSRPE